MNEIQYQSGAIDAGGCVSQAWSMLTQKFWLYVGIGFVTVLLIGCVPFVAWFLFGPVMAGFYYVGLRDMRGEPVEFGMMFKGFEKFLPLMLAGLIQQFPGIVMTIVQYTVDVARLIGVQTDIGVNRVPSDILSGLSVMIVMTAFAIGLFSVVWTIALSFAVPLILENDIGVAEALLTSLKAAGSNAGGLFLLMILEIIVAILGILAICLGIFVAIPVIYLANVIAYRSVFPYFDRTNFNTAPPPPDYYAGTFGRGQQ